MELQELVFFYLQETTNTLEVQFRLSIDSEEELRTDFIHLDEANDFGYELLMEDYNLQEDEEEDDFYWLESPSVDEDVLLSFLNEYYIINPDKLPKPELI